MSYRSLALLSIIFTLSSCYSYDWQVYQKTLSAKCRWQKVSIIKKHKAASLGASDMGPRWHKSVNSYHLQLSALENKISLYLNGALGYKTSHSSDFQIHENPDCSVLAVSADDGKKQFAMLSNTEGPFICLHKSYAENQTLPDALSLVSSALLHPEQHKDVRSSINRKRESKSALKYALEHKEQPQMRHDALRFIGQYQYANQDMVNKARALINEFPSLLNEVRQNAKLGKYSYLRIMALLPDATYQALFHSWLKAEYKKPISKQSCSKVYAYTNALLTKTAQLKSGNTELVGSMANLLRDPHCPLLKDAPNPYDHEFWSMRGENMRIWAIKTLALIPGKESRRELEYWSQKGCYKFQRVKRKIVKSDAPYFHYQFNFEADKVANNNSKVSTHQHYSPGCFAKAALNHLR